MTDTVLPIVEDPGPPYLLFDLYPFDLDNPHTPRIEDPPFERVVEAGPPWCGGILKATDGTRYNDAGWFVRNFDRLRTVASQRYASSWFRGAYHYLQFAQDPATQADAYVNTVERAGGWDAGTIMPIVDVEFGPERAPNHRANTQQIIDCCAAFAERCRDRTGRRVMLYGRGVMRDRSIVSKMGCDRVWNPSYTAHMVTNGLCTVDGKPGPWAIEDIAIWQYGGDGTGDASQHKLPLAVPGLGRIDVSVHVNGAQKPTLHSLRAALL
ncbi:MAG: lysozyme [Acidimicrobiaceae bacterium]|jgi:GH25 family lysozyme M1 (1,4-beta-N-acetylmuramidase)|nr:lysozyme [Acidimicrobiaceae bacterium]